MPAPTFASFAPGEVIGYGSSMVLVVDHVVHASGLDYLVLFLTDFGSDPVLTHNGGCLWVSPQAIAHWRAL